MTETAGATVTATARDGNGDTASPDDGAEIFAAIDCDGTGSETASATTPAILGAFWPQGMPAVSDSISSFASIGRRASSAEWRKFLSVNAARIEAEAAGIGQEPQAALVQLVATAVPPAPETSAGISAGVKLRICPKCSERPVRGPRRGECNVCHAAYEQANRPERERRKARRLAQKMVGARGLAAD